VRAWTDPLVVMHGDYRLDNLMFSRADGRLQATVLDWQAVRVGPPLIDAGIYLRGSVDDRR
jgi:aminoglycoside phosphotransferase (APT) family kinase protein